MPDQSSTRPADEAGIPDSKSVRRRFAEVPDEGGLFGEYGGHQVPDGLGAPFEAAHQQLDRGYGAACDDKRFWEELRGMLASFAGRPTPLYEARRLGAQARSLSGRREAAGIWLKREDLSHGGSLAMSSALGQVALAAKMGKKRVVVEADGGGHAGATAMASARLGLACDVFVGEGGARTHAAELARVRRLGARVVEVDGGRSGVAERLRREWASTHESTQYVAGSPIGAHPFPMIVRDFQSIVGLETKGQCLRLLGKLPTMIVAGVGSGVDAAGLFYPFIDDDDVQRVGVEGAGSGHASPLTRGKPGVLHGVRTYVSEDGAGRDDPGAGPEHAYWKDAGRVKYVGVGDEQALEAQGLLSRAEGILASLESARAIHEGVSAAGRLSKDDHVVVCLAGRGDDDAGEVERSRDGSGG